MGGHPNKRTGGTPNKGQDNLGPLRVRRRLPAAPGRPVRSVRWRALREQPPLRVGPEATRPAAELRLRRFHRPCSRGAGWRGASRGLAARGARRSRGVPRPHVIRLVARGYHHAATHQRTVRSAAACGRAARESPVPDAAPARVTMLVCVAACEPARLMRAVVLTQRAPRRGAALDLPDWCVRAALNLSRYRDSSPSRSSGSQKHQASLPLLSRLLSVAFRRVCTDSTPTVPRTTRVLRCLVTEGPSPPASRGSGDDGRRAPR